MKQVAVIGLGRFGSSVALTLVDLGCEVLGIDADEAKTQLLSPHLSHAVAADVTDEETLKSLGLRNFDVAVVAIGHNLQASILVTLMLKEMKVKRVIAKAANDLHGKVLERVGADRVVFPEREMGFRLAHSLLSSDVLDFIQLSPEFGILEVTANGSLVDRRLKELNLRDKYDLTILAIRRGSELNVSPGGEDIILAGDEIILLGRTEDLKRYEMKVLIR